MEVTNANTDRKIITYYIKGLRSKLAESVYIKENPPNILEK
jgi:hypothetical protein